MSTTDASVIEASLPRLMTRLTGDHHPVFARHRDTRVGDHTIAPPISDFDDAGLARLATAYQRQVEDGTDTRDTRHCLAHVRRLQLVRFRLRMRYGARDNGTDVYDWYYRLNEAPSYWLAAEIDRARAQAGQRHALAWAVAS